MKRAAPSSSLSDRLLRRRTICPVTGCWLWDGACDRYGYGKLKYKGVLLKTHRASLHTFKGMRLDDPLYGLHSCDNPRCFNPDHLSPGEPAENTQHIWERKRVRRSPEGRFAAPKPDNSDLPF